MVVNMIIKSSKIFLFALSVVLASCGGQPADDKPDVTPPPPPPPPVFTVADAAVLYAKDCAVCHGADGSGLIGVVTKLKGITRTRAELISNVRIMPRAKPSCNGIEGCDERMTDYLLANFVTLGSDTSALSCQQQGELLPPKLRRLTPSQFQNSVKAAFGDIFAGITWPDFGDGNPTIGMNNSADRLDIDSINYASIYRAVGAITTRVIQQNTQVNACAISTSTTCVSDLLNQFGTSVWRKPLTTSERTAILAAVQSVASAGGTKTQQTEMMLKALLMSPNFLYRQELGVQNGDVRNLTGYEIASLLSFSLWDSPPDATLYNLAASGQMQNLATIQQQVTRMIVDPRFETVVVKFYNDFLKLDTVLTIPKVTLLNFTQAIRESLLSSSELALRDMYTTPDVGLRSLLKGNSFYVNKDAAPIFGLDPNIFGTGFMAVAADADERAGMLTHPAFLAVHAKEGGSGLVKRGVFVLEQMLCEHLGTPPNDITPLPLPGDIDPDKTTERRLHEIRHSSQAACIGCHTIIDPAGVGFENYDALGRHRLYEKGDVEIDSSGKLALKSADLLFNNGVEYTQQLVETKELKACLNQRFLEFMIGQAVDKHSCESSKLETQVQQNGESIRTIVNALVQLESFRARGVAN
jgi:Protein of unknown function (DUF1588)/Protein of unknown function (DUF1592)/Protein of unknown function (DUF1595)